MIHFTKLGSYANPIYYAMLSLSVVISHNGFWALWFVIQVYKTTCIYVEDSFHESGHNITVDDA